MGPDRGRIMEERQNKRRYYLNTTGKTERYAGFFFHSFVFLLWPRRDTRRRSCGIIRNAVHRRASASANCVPAWCYIRAKSRGRAQLRRSRLSWQPRHTCPRHAAGRYTKITTIINYTHTHTALYRITRVNRRRFPYVALGIYQHSVWYINTHDDL